MKTLKLITGYVLFLSVLGWLIWEVCQPLAEGGWN